MLVLVATVAAADCVTAPPAFTDRVVAEMVPNTIAFASASETFVPEAETLLKLFVALASVILPLAPAPLDSKIVEPPTVRLPPDWVMELPETSARLPETLIAAVLTIEPVVLFPMVKEPDAIRLSSN